MGQAPTITGISAPTGSYKQDDVINITITFSQNVTVTGTPQLTLNIGGSDVVVDYSSGTGTPNLVFQYTVANGHNTAALEYKATTSLVAASAPTLGVPVYENTTGDSYHVSISGNYAYMADATSGLAIIDISDPTNPGDPAYSNTNGFARGLTVSGNYAYVADGNSGLAIIDISDPTNPGAPVYKDTKGTAFKVAISGNYAYVADQGEGLAIIDISDPTAAVVDANTHVYRSTTDQAYDVTISGNYAYVPVGNDGLAIINISNP
ncbi:MAG: hypothetical protein CBB92_05065, partial [Flammeovirgaceae bacterium TMED32]